MAIFFIASTSYAQTCFFHETFELPSQADSVTGTNTGTSSDFAINTRIASEGVQCDSAQVDTAVVKYLTTNLNLLNLSPYGYITLRFSHICRIDFFDAATIEVGVGGSWYQLTDAEMDSSSDSKGVFLGQNNQFSSASHLIWAPGQASVVADNSMWKHEVFNLGSIVQFTDSVQIRFVLSDVVGPGSGGYPGWFIDNICVEAATCELIPPTITQLNPILQTTVFNLGPYTLNINAYDISGVDSATFFYSINGISQTPIPMTFTGGNQDYTVTMPAVNDGDTVCYYFMAWDAAVGCNNAATFPIPCRQFIASTGVTLPFCDNFDTGILWADSTVAGSSWQLGTPNTAPPAPNSPPNSWDVALNQGYLDNTETYLNFTQVLSFIGDTNATVSFAYYCDAENGWDGANLQYSTDLGTTWITLGNANLPGQCTDPSPGVNWYNDCQINSSLQPGWTGLSSGWVNASHTLSPFLDGQPNVMFRFAFTSDAIITQNGFSVDDFCITVPPGQDVGVTAILNPTNQAPAGLCIPVVVTIHNFGSNTACNIPYAYSGSGGASGSAIYTGCIPPNGTVTDTIFPCFTIPGAGGPFNLCAWTALPGDTTQTNDTTCMTGVGIPVLSVSNCDDFESGNVGWVASPATGGWEFGTPNWGVTTGAHSPVTAWDVNLNGPYTAGAFDTLWTPIYDITGLANPYLTFWRNENTTTGQNDGFWVEYTIDGGNTWSTLGVYTPGTFNSNGDAINWYNTDQIAFNFALPGFAGNSNGWQKSSFFLKNAIIGNNNTVRFRFVFQSYLFGTPLDGVSIDDFCVINPPPIDIGTTAVSSATSSSPGCQQLDSVLVTIRNFGSDTLTSASIYFSINPPSQTFGPYLWTGVLAPGDVAGPIQLPFTYTVPCGAYDICSWAVVPGDSISSNDTTCAPHVGIPVLTLSNCDDFESGNVGWVASPATGGWEFGTPNWGATTGAHSGTVAWDIDLNLPYTAGELDTLYTPIYNVQNIGNPYLTFWQNRNTTGNQDGFKVEYTIDGGTTWLLLGVNSPGGTSNGNGINWYNTASLAFTGIPGWTGSSTSWIKSTYFLSNELVTNPNAIRFRMIFISYQFGIPADGVSIDDFCMIIPPPIDLGVTAVSPASPGTPACNTLDSVKVTIRNFGSDTLTTGNIYFSISPPLQNFGPFAWSGTLAPGASAGPIQLPFTYTVPCGQFDICAWVQVPGDSISSNDTLCIQTVGVPTIAVDYNTPYCDDFESGNIGWTVTWETNPQSGTPGDPSSVWELGAPAFGITTGAHSGTTAWDINLVSAYTNNAYVFLTSPIFDFSNAVDTKLDAWLQRGTELAWDGVWLEYSINGGAWTQLGTCGAPLTQAINWYNQCAMISNGKDGWTGNFTWLNAQWLKLAAAFNNQAKVQFRFGFTSDASVIVDGFTIDDFCLTVPVPLTVHPLTVNTTAINNCFIFPGQCINITSPVHNDGTTAVNGCTAEVLIDNVHFVTDTLTFATALNPNASTTYTSSICWGASPGLHTVCVITSLPNGQTDLKPVNDTACTTLCVFDTIPQPVVNAGACTDFETDSAWIHLNSFNYGPNNSWTWGTPAKPTINSAHSGVKCWVTELSVDYPNRDSSSLFTPVYSVVPGLVYNLEYWGNFDTEKNEDGGTVEYSTDYGLTWNILGSEQDPNWMNTYHITALGSPFPSPGWSSNSGGWHKYDHDICFTYPLTNQVIFRFRFNSDFSVHDQGWAVDDVCFKLTLNAPCALGINDPVADELQLFQNIPNPFNNTTAIRFNLPKAGAAKLAITNIIGQTIAMPVNGNMNAGLHEVTIDASSLAPGIYYYSLQFEDARLVKKMLIVE